MFNSRPTLAHPHKRIGKKKCFLKSKLLPYIFGHYLTLFLSMFEARHFQGEELESLSFEELLSLEKQLDRTNALARQQEVMSLN